MKNVHFAIPEIYGETLSYYELLRKLVDKTNDLIDNYNTVPEQIAEEVANLDASQLFSEVLNQLIHSIATDNTKSANAVKVYKKHDLLYATFNETVNLYESLIDFSTGTETELIIGTNIREVNISELFIELRKLIDINKNNIDAVTAVANENSAEIVTMHSEITDIKNKNTEQDNEISTLRTMISSPYNFKGEVASISALPASGEVNDTYYVQDVKYKVTWTGSAWVQSSLSEADYQTELSELKSDLARQHAAINVNYIGNELDETIWEVGSIRSTDGAEIDSTTCIRSGIIYAEKGKSIVAINGFTFILREYDSDGNYLGNMQMNLFVSEYTFVEDCYCRIVEKTNNISPAVSDYKNLLYNDGHIAFDRVGDLIDRVNKNELDIIANRNNIDSLVECGTNFAVEHVSVGQQAGKSFVYETPNNANTIVVNLEKGQKVVYSVKNANRCRVCVFHCKYEDVIVTPNGISPTFFSDEVLYYDDTLTTISGEYSCEPQHATLFFLLGFDNNSIDANFEFSKFLAGNVYVRANNVIQTESVSLEIIKDFEPFAEDYSAPADNPKAQPTTLDEFYSLFYNPYLGYYKSGNYRVTKRILGRDQSDTYDIFEYDFCPKKYSKTILLTSGLHAYETPASFGLAMWVRDLMAESNESLRWIKENVRVKIIPICNPWGFNQSPKKYGNVNGVNPNHNYNDWDNSWESYPVYSPNPEDTNYNEWKVKGSAPFSESETQIIAKWLTDNKTSEFWIDCHTGLGNSKGENWIIYLPNNPLSEKILRAVNSLENRIVNKYGIGPTSTIECNNNQSVKTKYATNVVGIPMMVLEQSEYASAWGVQPVNSNLMIAEYATQLHAYIVSMLMD